MADPWIPEGGFRKFQTDKHKTLQGGGQGPQKGRCRNFQTDKQK